MNKYLFLDIDGVLNHDEWFDSVHYKRHQENWKKSMFDPECVTRVNKILETTGARLVVSSSWRTMGDLKEIFEGIGLPTDFDITPCADLIYSREEYDWDSPVFWRGNEIKYYLDRHPTGNYVILDDDTDMLDEQWDNFVYTCADRINTPEMYKRNGGSGLTEKLMNKAIDILNGNAKTTDN